MNKNFIIKSFKEQFNSVPDVIMSMPSCIGMLNDYSFNAINGFASDFFSVIIGLSINECKKKILKTKTFNIQININNNKLENFLNKFLTVFEKFTNTNKLNNKTLNIFYEKNTLINIIEYNNILIYKISFIKAFHYLYKDNNINDDHLIDILYYLEYETNEYKPFLKTRISTYHYKFFYAMIRFCLQNKSNSISSFNHNESKKNCRIISSFEVKDINMYQLVKIDVDINKIINQYFTKYDNNIFFSNIFNKKLINKKHQNITICKLNEFFNNSNEIFTNCFRYKYLEIKYLVEISYLLSECKNRAIIISNFNIVSLLCTVDKNEIDKYIDRISMAYKIQVNDYPKITICNIVDGCKLI